MWDLLPKRPGMTTHAIQKWTVASVGAGINLTGIQALAWLHAKTGVKATLAWLVEAEVHARDAWSALAPELGHSAPIFLRAEDPGLARRELRVALELLTLRCSSYSKDNPTGKNLEPSLGELRLTLESVAVRRPAALIFENADGLWSQMEGGTRRRVETLLGGLGSYEWISFRVDPCKNLGIPLSRARVFYVGVRSA